MSPTPPPSSPGTPSFPACNLSPLPSTLRVGAGTILFQVPAVSLASPFQPSSFFLQVPLYPTATFLSPNLSLFPFLPNFQPANILLSWKIHFQIPPRPAPPNCFEPAWAGVPLWALPAETWSPGYVACVPVWRPRQRPGFRACLAGVLVWRYRQRPGLRATWPASSCGASGKGKGFEPAWLASRLALPSLATPSCRSHRRSPPPPPPPPGYHNSWYPLRPPLAPAPLPSTTTTGTPSAAARTGAPPGYPQLLVTLRLLLAPAPPPGYHNSWYPLRLPLAPVPPPASITSGTPSAAARTSAPP